MADVVFKIDPKKHMADQEVPGHNRWHPDIPAVVTVKPGDEVRVECKEWTDGQIGNNDSANDVRDADLSVCHMLSGPIAVQGAEPGDVLVVDILNIGPMPGTETEWGYTGIFARNNGGCFLTEYFPDAYKAVWKFSGVYASSRHIPDVRFEGISHPGLIGTAPSKELLAKWNAREAELIATNPDRVPPLAYPPYPQTALLGTLKQGDYQRVAAEGARTVPPREHGGNCDIKNLSRGSRIYFPVYVKGGNLSLGDLHFSQGDGEITFCGAIEMGGWVDLRLDVIKHGVSKYKLVNPIFRPGHLNPQYSNFLVFEGISVDDQGKQHYLDTTLAYKNACMNCIAYLKECGYTGEQAYLLLGAAPVEGRVSGVVDIPNACCTVYLPAEIFERTIEPFSTSVSKKSQAAAAK